MIRFALPLLIATALVSGIAMLVIVLTAETWQVTYARLDSTRLWSVQQRDLRHDRVRERITGTTLNSPPLIAPDGAHALWIRTSRDSSLHLFDMRSALRYIDEASTAHWSADGAAFIYTHENRLYYAEVSAPEDETLLYTDADAMQILLGAWSPDGTRVAFFSRRPGDITREIITLHILTLPGGTITDVSDTIGGSRVMWSPDSQTLAYVSYDGSANHVMLADRDGTATRYLHTIGDFAPRLSWSPDGRWLALGDGSAVMVLDSTDGTLRTLASRRPVGAMVWAPDSRRLAFIDAGNNDLYSAAIAGDDVRRLYASEYILFLLQ